MPTSAKVRTTPPSANDDRSGAYPRADLRTRYRRRAGTPSTGLRVALEERYRAEGHWQDLIALKQQRLADAPTPRARAEVLLELAEVLRDDLDDDAGALERLFEAFCEDPSYDAAVETLDELACDTGSLPAIAAAAATLADREQVPERELRMREHLVAWLRKLTGQGAAVVRNVERIRQIDPTSAAVHARQASIYHEGGAFRDERASIERALLTERRRDERLRLHLRLAALCEHALGDARSAKQHLCAALDLDPRSLDALRALVHLYEAEGAHAALAETLERLWTTASDVDERVAAARRLADLWARTFVRPAKAAATLEAALALRPDDASMLESLARCHALTQRWDALVATIDRQLALAVDDDARRALLRTKAETLETGVRDAAAALEAFARLEELTPGDAAIVAARARLAASAGHWREAASHLVRLADATRSARERARLYASAATMLAPPDRAPLEARELYERAVDLDDANHDVWSALVDGALRDGDHARAIEYLDRRARTTRAWQKKSRLYLEVARLRIAHLDDEAGAIAALEASLAADATNDEAVRALFVRYMQALRWRDAEPLCERLLVAARAKGAIADELALTRTAAQLATLLENPARAVEMAIAALELDPCGVDARQLLVEACHPCRDTDALATAQAVLERVAAEPHVLVAPARTMLAEIFVARRDLVTASKLFESTLGEIPDDRAALAGLADVRAARGDVLGACALRRRLADAADDTDRRVETLMRCGRALAAAGHLDEAIAELEHLRTLRPCDALVLEMLGGLYYRTERWQLLCSALRARADIARDPRERARFLYATGQVTLQQLGDRRAALKIFAAVVKLDASREDSAATLLRERAAGPVVAGTLPFAITPPGRAGRAPR